MPHNWLLRQRPWSLRVMALYTIMWSLLMLRPGRDAEYCDQPVCLSVCLSVCPPPYLWNRWTDLHGTFLRRSPVAVARSSSGGVAISYVLLVLWMTSRLDVMGATPKPGGCTVQRLPWAAWRYRDGGWCLWMLIIIIIIDWKETFILIKCRFVANYFQLKWNFIYFS